MSEAVISGNLSDSAMMVKRGFIDVKIKSQFDNYYGEYETTFVIDPNDWLPENDNGELDE